MSVKDRPTRITVTFCDDVRRELGNKISVMGVYQGLLGISAPVLTLPKLVGLVAIDAPSAIAPGSKITVRVMDRDTELLSAENIWPSPQHGSDEALVPGRSYMTMPVELVGFVAAEGMELRLEVACGDTSFVSDSLRVFYAAPISTASGEQVGEQP